MEQVRTQISIKAAVQTVWAVIDELSAYPEWNKVLTRVSGVSTVGRHLDVTLCFPGLPTQDIKPEILRIIPLREIRWITRDPTPGKFSAEHWLALEPQEDGSTLLHNNEDFLGSGVAAAWPVIGKIIPAAYEEMNQDLKRRAEAFALEDVKIHPALNRVVKKARPIRELTCLCHADPVRVSIASEVHHTHLCGCSQCWKPAEATMALVATVDARDVNVVAGSEHIVEVDPKQKVVRKACRRCGVHLYSTTPDSNHHFHGVAFVHPELCTGEIPPVEFAGFMSSLIGKGTPPHRMAAISSALKRLDIPSYDAFSPDIMAVIEWHRRKVAAIA